ncbi:hypothetical protein [uncultured Apibacter sp.]|uniref:hypothetical protein n=1 Tax=uncultured Apibacter sp. TaxID=1778616 RepID=UPI0025DDF3E8|nr:hypothetical protein [uncultured Apibacter sp.]
MRKIFLKFTAITIITSSLVACDNKHSNKIEKPTQPMVGLNAQGQEEIAPASPIDSSKTLKNENNPQVQGMNAQPQQEIAPSTTGNK